MKKSKSIQNISWQSFLCLLNEDNSPVVVRGRGTKKSMLTNSCFGLSRHLSCILLLFLPILLRANLFSPDGITQKRRRKIWNWFSASMFDSVPLLFYTYSSSLFSYDLPPFLATLVLVFLLADASPFLLDFFLVAIILPSYEHTIINDLLLILVRMEK